MAINNSGLGLSETLLSDIETPNSLRLPQEVNVKLYFVTPANQSHRNDYGFTSSVNMNYFVKFDRENMLFPSRQSQTRL